MTLVLCNVRLLLFNDKDKTFDNDMQQFDFKKHFLGTLKLEST